MLLASLEMVARNLPMASVLLVAVACGASDKPKLLGDSFVGVTPGGDGGLNDDAGVPTCESGRDQNVCSCTEVPLLGTPPNMYFVLDRSGSMDDDGKWTTIRGVVASVVTKLGPRIAVGAAVYPRWNGKACDSGGEVFPVRQGDTVAPNAALSKTAASLLASIPQIAAGGTPTAATLRALAPNLAALGPNTFVVLATDGGPNCNAQLTCPSASCIPNIESQGSPPCSPSGPSCCVSTKAGNEGCLDAADTVAAVTAIAKLGIPVYVIGVPGSGPYGALLDELATAGGTARQGTPLYYRVDKTDTAAFTATISKVAAQITATCTFPLTNGPADPGLVNVYLDGVVLPQDPVDGWTISGATVTLVGAACQQVLSGTVLSVRVIEGCPTVIPN